MLAHALPPPPPAPPPARVLVFADEFRFDLSRRRLPAGRLRLQMKNIGEDDHDLVITGPRGGVRARTGLVRPGRLADVRTRLAAGAYRVHCTIGDHAARGMRGTLVVTRPRVRRPPPARAHAPGGHR